MTRHYKHLRINSWARPLRLWAGVSMREVARRANLSPESIGRAERGGSVSYNLAAAIGQVYGLTPEQAIQVGVSINGDGGKPMERADVRKFRVDSWLRMAMHKEKLTTHKLAQASRISASALAEARAGKLVSLNTARAAAKAMNREFELYSVIGFNALGDDMAALIKPDYECVGCGHGVFGREPVHCPHCNGTSFAPLAFREGSQIDEISGVMRRILRDSESIRKLIHQSGHRRKHAIIASLAKCERDTQKSLDILLSTNDAYRHQKVKQTGI